MKKHLSDYITASATIAGEILRPDSCYPHCGTIVGNISAGAALDGAKKYLGMLIEGSWDTLP